MAAACFRDFTSCSSNVSARSTASPYSWSISDFRRDLSATSCADNTHQMGTQR
jgi:hypothetical protein